jgi:hypothetical protein
LTTTAIEEPAIVCEGRVDPDLIDQLLDDAQNNPDQLPLLQHVLMRLWDLAADKSRDLNLQSYHDPKKVGGLQQALSIHADEAYEELKSEDRQEIARTLFCLLTEQDVGRQDTRRPIEVSEVMDLTRRSLDEVRAVIDVFRRPGRSFLMPPRPRRAGGKTGPRCCNPRISKTRCNGAMNSNRARNGRGAMIPQTRYERKDSKQSSTT